MQVTISQQKPAQTLNAGHGDGTGIVPYGAKGNVADDAFVILTVRAPGEDRR